LKPHILINPSSRKCRSKHSLVGWVKEYLNDAVDITGASAIESALALKQAVTDKKVSSLFVAGGDGLIHLAIQSLALTDIPLTILPVGSGNDFALALGINNPLNKGILNTKSIPVDLLKIYTQNDEIVWVASIAIAGFPASINKRANAMILPLGPHKYSLATLLELPRFARTKVEISIDGEKHTLDSAMLAIGNTRYFGGGMLACPDASHNDGLFHLTSIEKVGRIKMLGHLKGRFGGTADKREVLRLSGKHLEVHTEGVDFRGDGEFIARSPLQMELVSCALMVRAPQ